ncbi:MAG TPA: glycosyltransferase family 1 protein [Terriglobia bacterium]|nr:glycosyltransferase family 1 protein [Terriglobia bacterium]
MNPGAPQFRPVRIAIDIRKINEFGIGSYIWNLVRNIASIDCENQYLLIGSRRNFYELGPLPENFRPLYTPISSLWQDHGPLTLALRRNAVDVLHVPHHDAPVWGGAKLLVTVHDCVHLLFPAADSSRFQRFRDYWRTSQVVRRASHILAVSNSTKEDLVNIFDLDPERISVIYNALDDRFGRSSGEDNQGSVMERYQIKDPFVLYSGRIRSHKNVHRLIEAFAVLKSEFAGQGHYGNLKLVIIGDELSRRQYLRLRVVQSGVQQDVRFFGFVPAPTLQVFYQSAALFAFPSLYEGFGLPPLEAMANRTPVLASNTSSLPEVLNDAALLVNPENVFEIARGMKAILLDEALRDRLIRKGIDQVSKFSWKTAAGRVVDIYQRIADPRRAGTGRAIETENDALMESSSSAGSPEKRLRI